MVSRQFSIPPLQLPLDLGCAEHGSYGAGKQDQQIIASGSTDHFSPVLLDQTLHSRSIGIKGLYGRKIILTDQPAVVFYIGMKDRNEFSFDTRKRWEERGHNRSRKGRNRWVAIK